MNKENQIYNKAFSNYISPSKYDKMIASGWFFERFRFGRNSQLLDLRTIKEYLEKGVSVKCGYMATSIKSYHDYYIISKE